MRKWVFNLSGECVASVCTTYPRIRFKFLLSNVDAAAAKNMKSSPLKIPFSKSSAKTFNTTRISAAMFLVDTYPVLVPLVTETSDRMMQFTTGRDRRGGPSFLCDTSWLFVYCNNVWGHVRTTQYLGKQNVSVLVAVRPSSDAVLHMSRIECKWEKSFVLPY